MTAPIVFLDTETTGLTLDDDIWEFAAIRREDGVDYPLHLFVEHSAEKAAQLPDSFRADHDERFDAEHAVSAQSAARLIHHQLRPGSDGHRAHVVGAVPNFDTERLARLLRAHGLEPNWHYHLIDVENLAVGYLHGRKRNGRWSGVAAVETLPWNSDGLSRACGVEPPTRDRRTAMGDVRWALALYERITQPEDVPTAAASRDGAR